MNFEEFLKRKKEIEKQYDGWTAHNIHLGDGKYTIDNNIIGDEIKLKRIIQITSDLAGKPFNELRILDLACLEGMYGIEAARQGAEVIALDVRKGNIEKTKLVKDYLKLDNLKLALDDVRNISKEKYGEFDVVYCFGILYHLDAPDVFDFVKRLYDVTKKVLILDTQISLKPAKKLEFEGYNYYGRTHLEHRKNASQEEKERDVWLSIDNIKSFWLTRNSLLNLLSYAGFTSSYECYIPFEENKPLNRITLTAFKGEKQDVISAPLVNDIKSKELPQESFAKKMKFYKMITKNSIRYHAGKFSPEFVRKIKRKIFN